MTDQKTPEEKRNNRRFMQLFVPYIAASLFLTIWLDLPFEKEVLFIIADSLLLLVFIWVDAKLVRWMDDRNERK